MTPTILAKSLRHWAEQDKLPPFPQQLFKDAADMIEMLRRQVEELKRWRQGK